MDLKELEIALEAILFVSAEPVPRQKLLETFEEKHREGAETALGGLIERYQPRADSGVYIEEVAGGLRLVTRPELNGYLRRFFEVSGRNKLSMAALETLAIVAYRQPITGPEIQELRGVSSSGVLKTLLEKRLVRISGRKEVVGKPFLYSSTREFLMHFGLHKLDELPPLEEFEEALGLEIGDEVEVVESDSDGAEFAEPIAPEPEGTPQERPEEQGEPSAEAVAEELVVSEDVNDRRTDEEASPAAPDADEAPAPDGEVADVAESPAEEPAE